MDRRSARDPGADESAAQLADPGCRLENARDLTASPEELTQNLETAYEELRVANEEVRIQHEQIGGLVRLQEAQRAQHDRLVSVVPAPVIVTDQYGAIRSVNAAAAVLAGMPPARMKGKPVFMFFATDARPALRDLLLRARSDPAGGHETGLFVSRGGQAVPVDISATALAGSTGTVSWLFLTRGTDDRSDLSTSISAGLRRLAALPVDACTRDDLLRSAAAVCADVLGPGTEVSIQLGTPGRPEAVASSGGLAQAVDGAQLASGEGPTADAFAERTVVVATELRRDDRWPGLAGSLGDEVGGAVAVPLETETGAPRGVLTAYRLVAGASDSFRESAELLALTVRQLLQERDLHEEIRGAAADLGRALASRAVIDQAKGIVMAHKGCTADEAFQHLVDLASTQHVKVRDLAQGMVDQVAPG